ncbi:protein CFAP20DC [Enoplosus armatus]|uniref:protein CFAP20DC n=1 Tax=Enoplosus armatus TaxID=215367 RepID=UPI0039934296
MFRNNYQGGAVVEIFSGQGKDPVARWKLCGGPSAIHKEYDKEVKGFVYCLEGSSQTVKMQMPENGKMSLGLLQRFLVLQVNIPQCKDFSIELVITDSEHLKRRLHLSTVHKELSSTLLHAKIPFVGLKRNIWSTLCIDLVSFTGELFKGFLTLDGITLFATCKVRRIFTMKTEPAGKSDDDTFLSGAGLMDFIPRSCRFPPDVSHVTQVLNMETLQKADMRAGLLSSECVPDQTPTARSTSYRRTRPQGVVHTTTGSRVSGPPPQTGRKSSAASDSGVLFISNTGSPPSRMNQKVAAEIQSIANLSENLSHGEPSHILLEVLNVGTPGSLQPHPPKDRVLDKQGSQKPRVYSAGRERLASSAPPDPVPGGHRKRSKTREKCPPPSSRQEIRQQPRTENTKHLTADECICSPAEESSGAAPTPAESLSCSIRPGLSCDLQVWSSWESNEGSEPQLTLQEEVFTFSSQPHSPKRGQGQGDQEKMEMGDDQVQSKSGRRYEAQPEDDFIGSESDEDKSYTTFQHQRTSVESNRATPKSPNPTLDESHNMDQTTPKELSPATTNRQALCSERAETAEIVPTRCLSPSRQEQCGPHGSEVLNQVVNGKSSVSLSRRLLQEVKLDDSTQHKEEEDNPLKPVYPSDYNLCLLSSLRTHGNDDEELRMLASLKREQEEDECRASGLSASQIHQCNVSISMSSDDTSTWTHISMPANQGHHYQMEMNPLLQSNPREWMDVLSPPIMPPSQRRRSGNTRDNRENLIGGGDETVNEEENEEEYLNLLYDPCLNCYFDPKTGKYYELV